MKDVFGYIFKIGTVYGNIIENEKPIVFYFEEEAHVLDEG